MKMIRKLKNHYIAKCNYIKYVKKLPIDDHRIVLESQQGKEFGGNIYYIAKELLLNKDYASFQVDICVQKEKIDSARAFYEAKGLSGIHFIETNTKKYYQAMASAKYLISDNTFLPYFIKKEGQIYLNTWHGTPLKSLGKSIQNDMHNIGNTQKNFVYSDYLLYPNSYTRDHMIEDYMLEDLCHNTYLMDGYPRNTAFFDEETKKEIIEKYSLKGMQVIAYMPTWRGTLSNKSNPIIEANLQYILGEFEENAKEDQIVYVNLHPIESASVDFSAYTKVKLFPKEYETYEFLNVADVLITDYSSVFFDFLNTRKKIILYTYDRADYLSSRGIYRSLDAFPFPIVDSMAEVIREINLPKQYEDEALLKEFCPYDDAQATHRICQRVLFQRDMGMEEGRIADNQKKNVFIYAGRLANNGITASLKNLLNNVDKEKNNYYLLFSTKDVRNNLDTVKELTQSIRYYCYKGAANLTISQKVWQLMYKMRLIQTDRFMKRMRGPYQYELQRIFASARVDTIIQFSGYGYHTINLFSTFPGNKVIYVHANMLEEIRIRKNQREDALRYAYSAYDKVAVVTDDIIEPTTEISRRSDNIFVCHNVIDHQGIEAKGKLPLQLTDKTTVYPGISQLDSVLSNGRKKFINVGRFSPEKGQMRLLDAFSRVCRTCGDVDLIIIGGSSYKDHYNKIVEHVEKLHLQDHVILVKNLPNPFPLVKKCDYSVLSSFAEGFGLVIAEADVLGLPVVSVDISGPRNFIKKYGGTLVPNSEEGLYEGMMECIRGNVPCMHVDYAQYNKEAVKEFEALL